jgi:hydrogenase maturation protein HypF
MRHMLRSVVDDLQAGEPRAVIARRFHNTVARSTTDVCEKIRGTNGVNRVVLSGGSFQNKLLAEGIYSGLVDKGFEVFTHRLVPPNDGGLALGQAVIAGSKSSV